MLSIGERIVRSAWRISPQRALSDVIGWGADRSLPALVRQPLLRAFVEKYGIDMSEAEKPLKAYMGLQDVFTRRLKPGARPIDGAPDAVVAPADGRLVEVGTVDRGTLVDAKGRSYTLAGLLGDSEAAEALEGGTFATIYLSPRDYHRVHTPVAGRITSWCHVPGTLFPVNEKSVAREPALFSKNERFVTMIESEAGPAAVVMVAAVGVGHMTASFDPDVATHQDGFSDGMVQRKRFASPLPIARGGEVGIFNLGSTAIVVFAKGRVRIRDWKAGIPVRMGERFGDILPAGPA